MPAPSVASTVSNPASTVLSLANSGGFVLFGVIAVLVILGAIWGAKKAKERRDALAALADRLGWGFDPHPDRGHDEEYGHFEIFRRGYGRVAYNTLRGSLEVQGRPCRALMGDFRYKQDSGSGKNRRTSTYRFSYLIVHLPFRTPALLIRPEGIFDKLKGAFGFDDIDFESEDFSRKFYVKSDDKRFAYDVCHARMMEYLLANRPPMIDIENGRICSSDGSRSWTPERFERAIEDLDRFLALWPEHVTRDLLDRP